ncbi:hypothetical protein EDD17DRAFT_1466292 [Pisolithus thermaeus]|nr:hypothetical protein EDD17DRAFT_1466292 [Pisolithus thermaeus]
MSSDPRFLHLRHDPRFRRPKKHQSEVVQDERFRVSSRTHEEEAKAAVSIADYARGIVLMESSDEEEEYGHVSVDAHREEEAEKFHPEADRGPQEEVQKTRRLAVVNMDWDHIRAVHLFKIFSSLVSHAVPPLSESPGVNVTRGSILSVRVYPSEFGKKRIEKEEKEGPPQEVFKKPQESNDEVNERTVYEIGSGEDYDEDALRTYQLERLRYYYAIVECDSVGTATHIFNELDGTELERSANVFDLSFVPDDMTFEGDPRDEATELPNAPYRPIDFSTDALRHSKVKLTWDEEDPERSRLTRCALSRKDIEDADFKAYIASSSESADEHDDSDGRVSKKGERERLRALLLRGHQDELPEGWEDAQEAGKDGEAGSDVDMEITFTPGLSTAKGLEDQTTLERYEQKVREKRRRKKEARKAAVAEDTAEADPHAEGVKPKTTKKKKRRSANKGHEDDSEAEEDFSIDVKDDRFRALHEDHQFAIDPSNPQFKKTQGMMALLEERSKRRKDGCRVKDDVPSKNITVDDGRSLHNLAERVKRKSSLARDSGVGKRRKL